MQVPTRAAREVFAQAVDLVAQVGGLEGKRRILGVWETAQELEAGKVVFREVHRTWERELGMISRKRA